MSDQNPQVKVFESTKQAAEQERDEDGINSLGAVIEGWRRDAETLRALRESDFKSEMQTRGDAGP